jgi:spore maturation protein CgeB
MRFQAKSQTDRLTMRVFSAVRHSLDPKYYYGGLWSGNFHPALKRLGHDLVESRVDLKPAWDMREGTAEHRHVRAAITEAIVAEVRVAHRQRPVDLFLSYFYNAHFDPAGFDDIHRLGIPTINFYCNSICQFELVDQIAPRARFAWHAEKHARASYLQVGANPIWVQMGADPEIYCPVDGVARADKACFVGQRYADRDRWMAALIDAEVPVEIFGYGWGGTVPSTKGTGRVAVKKRRLARFLQPGGAYLGVVGQNLRKQGVVGGLRRTWAQAAFRQESKKIGPRLAAHARGPSPSIKQTFSQYAVVLNLSNVWADGRPGSALIPHVRLRDFEGPMCRTCFLTGHTDEIEEFYKVGVEIDTYRCPDELVAKTRFYLAHPEAAERIRDAGYNRARRDHTWECRFRELFQKTGLSGR